MAREFKDREIIKVLKILRKNMKDWRTPVVTEVAYNFQSPFHVLISCILSLRTKDNVTRKAAHRLFKLSGSLIVE